MEEKIGMEKLIELLNEFETPQSGVVFKSYDDYDGTFYGVDIDGETEIAWSDSFICGKRFQWVKWLVENDKIEWEKVYENLKDYEVEIRIRAVKKLELSSEEKLLWYLELLMLLSIQDEPISFLCEILK